MKPRRIDKYYLPVGPRYDSLDSIARRLRLGSDNRYLLPHQAVQERGLPRIRPPYDGHKSRPKEYFLQLPGLGRVW